MRGLPGGYTEKLAIETTGSSRINTGIGWLTHPRVVMDVYALGGHVFGEQATSSRRFCGGVGANFYCGAKRVEGADTADYLGSRCLFEFTDTYLKINGTQISTFDGTGASGTNSYTLRLFGSKADSGGVSNGWATEGTRIYSAKFYKTIDGTEALVLDAVPCVRDADGKVGFYDFVSQTFLGAEVGSFLAIPFESARTLIDEFWLDSTITSNSAATHGIRLQKEIEFEGAEPNVEAVSVPGRNGDILLLDGTYKNVTGKAECYCLSTDVAASITAVNQWLLSETGYRRLETMHEPNYFRMARITKGATLLPRLNRINAFEIEFDCKPQKFLKTGETAIAVSSGDTINNPTRFLAKPLIVFTVTTNDGYANISFDGSNFFTVDISGITPGYTVEIDVEERTVKVNGSLNYDHKCAGAFDWFYLGTSTEVTYSGYISNVTITPRWWTL